MKQLRFAVIGCGALAMLKHIPNIAASNNMILHTCCDISEEALKVCREKYHALHTTNDWTTVVCDQEIDAICLVTHETLRLPIIEAAARNGKPVYVEKPLANNLPEIYEIQRVVKEHNIPFCVGHNRRNSPAMMEAHRIFRAQMDDPRQVPWRWVRDPEGKPQRTDTGVAAINVRINDDWNSWKNWVFCDESLYGPMLFEMTHFTDICNWFMGAEPVEVVALESGMFNHGIIIKYGGGEIATLNMCACGTFGYGKELYEAMGNGGMVVCEHMCEVRTAGIPDVPQSIKFPLLDDIQPDIGTIGGYQGWLEKRYAACQAAAAKHDPMLQFTAEPDKGHLAALENFVRQINGLCGEVCGVDDAVMATRVAFAAILSARERRVVALSEV